MPSGIPTSLRVFGGVEFRSTVFKVLEWLGTGNRSMPAGPGLGRARSGEVYGHYSTSTSSASTCSCSKMLPQTTPWFKASRLGVLITTQLARLRSFSLRTKLCPPSSIPKTLCATRGPIRESGGHIYTRSSADCRSTSKNLMKPSCRSPG